MMMPLDRHRVLQEAVRIYEERHGTLGDARLTLAAAVGELLRRGNDPEENAAMGERLTEGRMLNLQAAEAGMQGPFRDDTFRVIEAARSAIRKVSADMN